MRLTFVILQYWKKMSLKNILEQVETYDLKISEL